MSNDHRNGFGPGGVIFCAFFTFAAITCAGTYSGGAGTAEDPYKISAVADWQELIAASTDWYKHFVLLNDIDFSGANLTPVAPDTDPVPYNGFQGTAFTGVFDGNDHVLHHAVIILPDSDYVGLFGFLGSEGQIRRLCAESIAVTGRNYVGGLCGWNEGTISDCSATGAVAAAGSEVGGLVGYNEKGVITSCYATGPVSGTYDVGGLVGANIATVTSGYATGTVSGYENVGGLAGINYSGRITFSFATGAVTGYGRRIGGLVGSNADSGTIDSCYATGAIKGTGRKVGGLVGDNRRTGIITYCYSTGKITSGGKETGGLVGDNTSSVNSCFWDIQTSGRTYSAGGTGLTPEQMKNPTSYLDAGWDFATTWWMPSGDYPRLMWQGQGSLKVTISPSEALAEGAQWRRVGASDWLDSGQIDTSAPGMFLEVEFKPTNHWIVWEPIHCLVMANQLTETEITYTNFFPLLGNGTEEEPFQIDSVSDLQLMDSYPPHWDKYFVLVKDLDLMGVSLTPVGNSVTPFTGVFEGNGHILRNAVINQSENEFVGLFGYVGAGGQIGNLGLEDCTITGSSRTGSLVGRNEGVITACYATGSVTGNSDVGGLAGQNPGLIRSCFADCIVTAVGSEVGGLVGQMEGGAVVACYAKGAVAGLYSEVGGLVGRNEQGAIEDCYAAGIVTGGINSSYVGGLIGRNKGPVNRCFWDIKTSGQTASEGGKALSTYQMKSITLFQQFGWAGKGWVIEDGNDYPRLAWEGTAGTEIPEPGVIPLTGSGTEDDPYQVHTAEDFAGLSWHWAILDKHIRLMNDLDLQGVQIDPIGDLGSFSGMFDGQGYILRNAGIRHVGNKYVGLFGRVGIGGRIQNIGTENVYMEGGYSVGGLVGDNDGSVKNCYATGMVKGLENVGGLVGDLDEGEISGCYTGVTVSGSVDIGGLVGQMDSGSVSGCNAMGFVTGTDSVVGGLIGKIEGGDIYGCYATGEVRGYSTVGGLAGRCISGAISSCYTTGYVSGNWSVGSLIGDNSGIISSCYATGTVKGSYSVGGLVGGNYGSMTSCYATGDVSSNGYYVGGLAGYNGGTITASFTTGVVWGIGDNVLVGGLVGYNDGTITTSFAAGTVSGIGPSIGGLAGYNGGTITACYSTGVVNGIGDYVGGLVGGNGGTITACYATGVVNGISDFVGGLCGRNDSTITVSFWDMEASGLSTSSGGTGKTTGEMTILTTYASDPNEGGGGWDVVGESANGTMDLWRMCADGAGYPRLSWEYSLVGDFDCPDGTALEDLFYLAQRWLSVTPETTGAADGNGDGTATMEDLAFVSQYWPRTPTLSIFPMGGTFTNPQEIQLMCDTEGITLYYTLDGSEPTIESNLYSGPFMLDTSCTIQARAFKAQYPVGEVVTAEFVILVMTPVISPDGATFISPQEVILWCETEGATMYYTTEGTEPTQQATAYTGPFMVSSSCTLKVRAFKEGWTGSEIASAEFMSKVATPKIVPNGGSFSGPQEVTLFCETEGTTIYYTTDGTETTQQSIQYTGPFTIGSFCTLKVRAFKVGSLESDIESTEFVFGTALSMILIPGGTFQMGDSIGDGYSYELPVHTVTLDSFYMSKYEMTNAQYCAFLKSAYPSQLKVVGGVVYASNDTANHYPYCDTSSSSSQITFSDTTFTVRTKGSRNMINDPMVMVSWYGAAAYSNWRSQQEGKQTCYDLSTWNCDFTKKGYRLATEAEWEYAARGGLSGKRFPRGDTITHSQANYCSDSTFSYDISITRGNHPTWNDGITPYTSPVSYFPANGYGLCDMAGNVWEWCYDRYLDSYYNSSPQINPTGPSTGITWVIRGGHWGTYASYCTVFFRNHVHSPSYCHDFLGFRVVLKAE